MAVDYFLKISGIDGESNDAKHKGEIVLESFSWGEKRAGSQASGSGSGASRVVMQDFSFVQRTSKASPRLFLACANGSHIQTAVLTVRKSGNAMLDFLTYKLYDLIVSSFEISADEDAYPLEQVTLDFSKIEVLYTEQDAKGGSGGTTKAAWDLKANKAF